MKELKNKIEKAGKLDKLALFVKLIKKQCKEKDSEYYKTYKEALKIIEEYLSFDENPPDAICKNLLEIYNYSFKTIRGTGEIENFSEIQDSFFKYEKFFKDNELLALIYSNFNFFPGSREN